MLQQTRYNAIDITKILMAFIVVGIHVNAFSPLHYTFLNLLFKIPVPVFFVVSGFLLQNKIEKEGQEQKLLKNSISKILRLYLLWTLVYLPLSIIVYCHDKETIKENIYNYFHLFFFVGETKFAWPLWYIHSLLFALILNFISLKIKIPLFGRLMIALLLSIVGYLIGLGLDFDSRMFHEFIRINKLIFVNPSRNGIYEGFLLICTGMVIRKYLIYIRHPRLLGILSLFVFFLLFQYKLPFVSLMAGGGMFLFAISFQFKEYDIFPKLRIHSMLIYFLHMYVLYFVFEVFNFELKTNLFWIITWLMSFSLTWIISIIIDNLRKRRPFGWFNYFLA